MKYLHYLILGVMIVLVSCNSISNSPGEVELYLLRSYETIGTEFQIDEATVVLKESPLVAYSDFLSYDSQHYTFLITDNAKDAIANLEHSVHGVPFAIVADNTLIYTGYFWPSYSSQSCTWLVIESAFIENNLTLSLGYPGGSDSIEISDRRNDSRILAIFRNDDKLIE